MNLKTAVARASLAGGVGLALLSVSPALAVAAPCGPPGAQCGPGAPGGQGPHGQNIAPRDDQPRDRGPNVPPHEDWHNPGGPRDDWHGPGNWGPRPPDAFHGWRDAPWGDGPAPWGWGAPPPPAWSGPLPDPFGPPPPPINYWGYQEQPVWDQGQNQWGFWFFGIWIPLPTL